jgi:ABC-type branched-subunit amino acid transport system substrate-binding protein
MLKSLALAVLAAMLAGAAGTPRPANAADASPFTIDVILSMTGQGAFVGQAQHDTLVALENVENKRGGIQGRPIHFAFKDDATTPQVAVQAVNAAIGVLVALGRAGEGQLPFLRHCVDARSSRWTAS